MDKRFTVKDLFLFCLLGLVILVVLLAMKQYDRQWDTLKTLERQTAQQTGQLADLSRELNDLRRSIARGVRVNPEQSVPTTTQPADDLKDAFASQIQAMKNPDYAYGDWLVQNLGTKLSKLTPLLSSDVYATIIQARVIESLAYRDPETFEWRPLLATGWDVSQDGLRITFQLRKNVTFSDGQPFTADDVVWTFEWIMNEKVDAPRQRAYLKENIQTVEKNGDYEVTFVFAKPYFESFGIAAGFEPLPKHFYSRYTPEQFNQEVGLLLGTGPYRLKDPVSWRPGTTVDLVRNERYWGLKQPFDRLLYYEVENDAAELTMFRNGELDIFGAQPEQYLSMIQDKSITDKANFFEYSSITGGYSYVAWNQRKGDNPTIFADKRVRQAMTMLIDRQRMAQDIYRGYASVASGPFLPGNQQNAPDVSPWPYDPQLALKLLKEAGFEDRNGDGILESPTGEPFRFSLTYGNKNPISERIALFIKDSLARVGIQMIQEPTDWPIMLKKLDEKNFDAITLGWTGGIETDLYQMFHSSQTIQGGDNYMSYVNPELDKVIEAARSTVDESKRMPLWQQAHRILHEDQPYTFLLNRKSLIFIDKRIRNVQRTRSGLNFLSTSSMPNPWYVPLQLQKHTR
ncbi:MAG: peptide-binding protein [Phycisphaerae bacterium]|jgi:peptide/nickel transport system substrate-binding protein|nr:MAG: peptide-binding protein [Phycisphaerae bacterium]